MSELHTFNLHIGQPNNEGLYQITLTRPGFAAEVGYSPLPFKAKTINQLRHEVGLIRELVANRKEVKELGRELFNFLFPEAIKARFYQSLRPDQPLRIQISWAKEQKEMGLLPWECLVDPIEADGRGTFLIQNKQISLVRFPPGSGKTKPVKLKGTVRILLVTSGQSLNDAGDLEPIKSALKKHQSIEVYDLKDATLGSLSDALRKCQPHILYIVAHGSQNEEGDGALTLTDKNGKEALITAEVLKDLIPSEDTRLVLLNSCNTADGELSSVAPNLVQIGVPAVLGMQFKMPGSFGATFMEILFSELVKDGNIEKALHIARKIGSGLIEERFWLIPTLFMNAESGQLWESKKYGEKDNSAKQFFLILVAMIIVVLVMVMAFPRWNGYITAPGSTVTPTNSLGFYIIITVLDQVTEKEVTNAQVSIIFEGRSYLYATDSTGKINIEAETIPPESLIDIRIDAPGYQPFTIETVVTENTPLTLYISPNVSEEGMDKTEQVDTENVLYITVLDNDTGEIVPNADIHLQISNIMPLVTRSDSNGLGLLTIPSGVGEFGSVFVFKEGYTSLVSAKCGWTERL